MKTLAIRGRQARWRIFRRSNVIDAPLNLLFDSHRQAVILIFSYPILIYNTFFL